MAPVEDNAPIDNDRSNKGASKQRRDQINAEINILRDLLPLPESSRQRLSQLQVMSLSCVYIRKCNVLKKIFRQRSQEIHLPDSLDFFQAMSGFLLVTTKDGKLIYISENVTDYLGHSMVDMKTQGDSLFDIIDKRDHSTVRAKLSTGPSRETDVSDDVSFFCRMNMSRTLKRQAGFGDVKVMHVQGHFVPVSNKDAPGSAADQQSVFMASCSPLMTPELKENLVLSNTMVFKTVHRMDMGFIEVTKMAEHHLGYTSDELSSMSWYTLIHPQDIQQAKDNHMQLIRPNHHEVGCMMTIRMMKADGTIFWVNIVMQVKQAILSQSDEPFIVCINQVISAQEAAQIKGQSQMFSPYPGRVQDMWGGHLCGLTPQTYNGNQWVQQEGNNAVPVPSYQCSMPNFPTAVGFPGMYSGVCDAEGARKAKKETIPNVVHSDKLKAMLKRKIQGPTNQVNGMEAKIPKMMTNVDGSSLMRGYSEMRQPPLMMSRQMVENGRYPGNRPPQVVQVMLASTSPPPGMRIPKQTYKSYPEITALSGEMTMEQVVPDMSVPDSYLTPDPSPISSPEPSTEVKTEVMDPDEPEICGPSSVSIIQALEKLASQPQQRPLAKAPESHEKIKEDLNRCSEKLRNRGLPIFDAFDIDNFFDNMLTFPEPNSKASLLMENIKTELEMQIPKCCEGDKGERQMLIMKKENNTDFITPSGISLSSDPISVTTAPIKTEAEDTEFSSCQRSRKDLFVSSTMIGSPQSIDSHGSLTSQESFDDLLSCFSDEGSIQSPFALDRSLPTIPGKSEKKEITNFQNLAAFDSLCHLPAYAECQRSVEEMSPRSGSSFMSRQDESLEQSWGFGMDLECLDTRQVQAQPGIGLDVFDQVDLLLDSLVPS